MTARSPRSSSRRRPPCSSRCGWSPLLIMAAARRAPRPRYALLRLVLANIHRPGALTPSVVLSLGLGLALLVTLLQIDGNLRRQFVAALPDKAPSVFFVDIQDADAARFDAFARQRGAGGALRARADAARAHRQRARRARRGAQGAAERRLGAAERPRHHLRERRAGRLARRRGRMVEAGLPGPAAGLVREQDRRRARAEDRRSGRRQRARPQHHGDARQPARGRLAVARHQFRAGVLARQLPRRAAYPHRDLHVSRAARRSSRRSPCSRRQRPNSRPRPRCACARRSMRSPRWCST